MRIPPAGIRPLQLLVFGLFALPLSVIDARTFRLPDALTLGGFAALAAATLAVAPRTIPPSLIAAGLAAGLLWTLRIFMGGLGLGDVKYAALVGFFAGPRWLPSALSFAAAAGIIYALAARAKRGRSLRERIPFGPFLTFGALASFALETWRSWGA